MNKFNIIGISIILVIMGCSKKEPPNILENQVKVYNDSKNIEAQLQESADDQKKLIDAEK